MRFVKVGREFAINHFVLAPVTFNWKFHSMRTTKSITCLFFMKSIINHATYHPISNPSSAQTHHDPSCPLDSDTTAH